MTRVLALTSTFRRHHASAKRVAGERRLRLAGLWQEEKTFAPLACAEPGTPDAAVIAGHFDARDRSDGPGYLVCGD